MESSMAEPTGVFPRPRFPFVTALLLILNLVGFVVELKQGSHLPEFLNSYSFVPAQMLAYLQGTPGTGFLRSVLPFFLTPFLHAGFVHLVINTFYLWLVGDVMESFLGRVRFILLWLAGVVLWGAVVLVTVRPPLSGLPCLGSGGAVAAILGAYLGTYRYLLRTARPLSRRRLLTMGTPMAVAVVAWIPLQLVTGNSLLTTSLHTEHGAPWGAILSCFVLGALLVQFLLPRAPTSAEAPAYPSASRDPVEAIEAGAVGSCPGPASRTCPYPPGS